jgi:alpha-beta hydrolase superfamily lysophospholipase
MSQLVTKKRDISSLVVDITKTKIMGADARRFQIYKWVGENTSKGTMVICHGQSEHAQVYDTVAKNFVREGYVVYALDHIGHGDTIKDPKKLGLWEENSFTKSAYNIHVLISLAKQEYPDNKISVIGHDLGGSLAIKAIAKFNTPVDSLILSGIHESTFKLKLMKWRFWIAKKLHLDSKPSFGGERFINRKYNKWFVLGSNDLDWVTSDKEALKAFKDDPKCGFTYTYAYYYYHAKSLLRFYKKNTIGKLKKNLPILVIGGSADSVNGFGKGTLAFSNYLKNDFKLKKVNVKMYTGARHYIYIDSCKYKVIDDIMKWNDNNLFKKEATN